MDINALQLLSAFAYQPNQLGYCGTTLAHQPLLDCLTTGNCRAVPQSIQSFKGLYPYLKTIAQVTKKDPFDYQVAEAYWLGNDLLKQFTLDHYPLLVKNLSDQGLPDVFINQITNRLPKSFYPLHLFNILHIGVGEISGTVKTNLENINHCMIRWGRVTSLNPKESTAAVYLVKLLPNGPNQYRLQTTDEIISFRSHLTPYLKPNDMVAVHWDLICKILEPAEQAHLSFWTNTLLQSL